MEDRCVLLDTNFVIQFMNEADDRHDEILGFFRTFLEKRWRLKFSTISIAEYCSKGKLDELPLRNLEVLPFNTPHAKVAGELTRWLKNNNMLVDPNERPAIKDDAKLLAQLEVETELTAFATSDKRLITTIKRLKSENILRDIQVLDTNENSSAVFNLLPFPE